MYEFECRVLPQLLVTLHCWLMMLHVTHFRKSFLHAALKLACCGISRLTCKVDRTASKDWGVAEGGQPTPLGPYPVNNNGVHLGVMGAGF